MPRRYYTTEEIEHRAAKLKAEMDEKTQRLRSSNQGAVRRALFRLEDDKRRSRDAHEKRRATIARQQERAVAEAQQTTVAALQKKSDKSCEQRGGWKAARSRSSTRNGPTSSGA